MSNLGGARPGAGRKSKAEELGLPRLMSKAVSDEENIQLIKLIFKKALEGSAPHANLYCNYKWGKPKETGVFDINIIDIPAVKWVEPNEPTGEV